VTQKTKRLTHSSEFSKSSKDPAAYEMPESNAFVSASPPPLQLSSDIEQENEIYKIGNEHIADFGRNSKEATTGNSSMNPSKSLNSAELSFSSSSQNHSTPYQFKHVTTENSKFKEDAETGTYQKSGINTDQILNELTERHNSAPVKAASQAESKIAQLKEDENSADSAGFFGSMGSMLRQGIDAVSNTYTGIRDMHYNRNQRNQVPQREPVNDPDWRLLPENQSLYHQHGEAGRLNKKYVSSAGGNFEAVYDADGNLVEDDQNMGTYNFHGPDDTFGHLKMDVLPYWLWGNTENDNTPLANRVAGPRILERAGNALSSAWDNTGGKLIRGVGSGINEASEAIGGMWNARKQQASEQTPGEMSGTDKVLNFFTNLISTDRNQSTENEGNSSMGPNAAPGDSIQSNIFSDGMNGVRFDEASLENQFLGSTFQGADSLSLRLAMMTLYENPTSGFKYTMALTTIANERNLNFQQAEQQYARAQSIRNTGRENYKARKEERGEQYNQSEDDPSPDLNLALHPLFTASDGQLRFGKIIGDAFGIDAVFGSLVSPTGGIVGPGNSFPVFGHLDPKSPVSIHGAVHDAAGYLYNCHNMGPGYDYLNNEDSGNIDYSVYSDPLEGQDHINWWNDVYRREGREVPWSAELAGRGSRAFNPYLSGEASHEKGYDHDPDAENAIRALAPAHMLYELAAHDIAYKGSKDEVPDAVLDAMANNGYMTNSEAGMKFFKGPMGFRAVLILSEPGSGKNPLLAIRGTNPGTSSSDLETIMTDLDEASVGAQQFQLNAVLIQAILQSAKGSAKVDVTGHSLGGAMAQHTAVNFPSMVANVVTFQSPGIDQQSVDRFNSLPEDVRPNITHHIVTGDMVDKAGQGNLQGDVYEHDFGSFLNLFQLLEDIQRHSTVVKSAADALIDVDFSNPGQNLIDYNHLVSSVNNFTSFLGEVGSDVGAAHSARVFSAANYSDIRSRHGVSDDAFAGGQAAGGNMAGTDARLGRFSGHPHNDERMLAEAVRSALGPELQRLFRLVLRAMETYESLQSSAQGVALDVIIRWQGFNSNVNSAVESIRNRLPF
jgi:pimeloyl-ACP methyl ester carboxylesterase